MRQVILSFCMVAFFASCAKDEIIHEDLLIDGNQPPDITGVSIVQVNNYVNSLYIDLYGRTPTSEELSAGANALIESDYDSLSRLELVSDLMDSWEYYKNFNLLIAQQYLVDADSISMQYQIDYWEYVIDLYTATGDDFEVAYYTWELNRLLDLTTAHVELANGEITMNTYFRRYLDNYYYDQVNMGSLNFVISAFNNLFHRYPTNDEEASGVAMVDGTTEQLFLMDGSSKGDFMDIMTTTPEFNQGLIISAFTAFLARNPTAAEVDYFTQQLLAGEDYNAIKKTILISEEYAGF